MLYELVVCFRYLRPRFSRAYISFNTVISIIGIAVGVTTLITVIAVMTGFGKQIRDGFTGFFSHIIITGQVETESGKSLDLVRGYTDLLHTVENTEGVVAASPFIRANVVFVTHNMSWVFPVRGVVPELETSTSSIEDKIVEGEFAFPVEIVEPGDPDTGEEPIKIVSVLVSKVFAKEAKLKAGDIVKLSSAAFGAMGRSERALTAKVAGIFSFGTIEQDQYVYTSLETAQILQGIGNDVCSGISVLTEKLEIADEVRERLAVSLGEDYWVKTWIEMNPELFDLLNQERFIMYVIVALIVAVAALNIISSLSMMVNHKRKEIGILRSMGAKRRSITAIFGMMGVLIGTAATGLGVIGGLAISLNFNGIRQWVYSTFGFKLFDVFDVIPVVVRASDVLLICGIAVILCILASIYPAWKASRLHPVEALRYE